MAIHPTAIINPHAEIDPSVDIGPWCTIDANVHLAAGCRLAHNVFVTGWTRIGENSVIHPGAIIGHEPQDVKYKGERSFCRIGRDVVLREYVTVHRGTDPESETVVGDRCFLLGGAHVAHNCVLGEEVTLINGVLLAGHVRIGDRALVGGGATVHQFVRMGEFVMIPGNSRVPMDVVPYALLDVEGRVAGINRVGLRRAGFDQERLKHIRDAYRVLFDRSRSFTDRLQALSALPPSDPLERIRSFVEAPSRRGLAGSTRGRRASTSDPRDE